MQLQLCTIGACNNRQKGALVPPLESPILNAILLNLVYSKMYPTTIFFGNCVPKNKFKNYIIFQY